MMKAKRPPAASLFFAHCKSAPHFTCTMQHLIRPLFLAPLWAALALLAPGAQAQTTEQQAGRAKAQSCTVCHGPVGVSSMPDTPHIAGQPAIYLSTQLRAYRSGARKHEVMAVMAKPLTDDEISQLASWFSSVRIEATAPY
jgi:cytochrome c553